MLKYRRKRFWLCFNWTINFFIERIKEINRFKKFIRLLLFLIIIAVVVKAFFLGAYRIPTTSMANTLFPGDFILVNFAAYKLTTPQELPIIGVPLKPVRLFDTGKPEVNDLVVFKLPEINYKTSPYLNSNLVKRIVAGPGDTLQIKDKKIFINGNEILLPNTANRSFKKVKQRGKEDEGIFFIGTGWNSDNYGPLVIPSKGDIIKIDNSNIYRWKRLITYEYEKKVVRQEGSVITIDDRPAREYIVQKDHYFVIGDNFNNSLDSRYFGFINEDMIIGQVVLVYWSADPSSGIRWGRIFTLM